VGIHTRANGAVGIIGTQATDTSGQDQSNNGGEA
jgi:hypothetical protein